MQASPARTAANRADPAAFRAHISEAVGTVIVGKERAVGRLLIALACGGHVLLEDVPGTGKTTLAKTLAATLGCTFKRVQFTPDFLPSDVTGSLVYDQSGARFVFHPGPIFAGVLLADEINRATPRTQSALLEAMEERQVTVEGVAHPLPVPFVVLATQNPLELEGTFPLPEAQLDRFFMRLAMGYPTREEEERILERTAGLDALTPPDAVVTLDDLRAVQQAREKVRVGGSVRGYLLDVVAATATMSVSRWVQVRARRSPSTARRRRTRRSSDEAS